jgi:hypothetical protein
MCDNYRNYIKNILILMIFSIYVFSDSLMGQTLKEDSVVIEKSLGQYQKYKFVIDQIPTDWGSIFSFNCSQDESIKGTLCFSRKESLRKMKHILKFKEQLKRMEIDLQEDGQSVFIDNDLDKSINPDIYLLLNRFNIERSSPDCLISGKKNFRSFSFQDLAKDLYITLKQTEQFQILTKNKSDIDQVVDFKSFVENFASIKIYLEDIYKSRISAVEFLALEILDEHQKIISELKEFIFKLSRPEGYPKKIEFENFSNQITKRAKKINTNLNIIGRSGTITEKNLGQLYHFHEIKNIVDDYINFNDFLNQILIDLDFYIEHFFFITDLEILNDLFNDNKKKISLLQQELVEKENEIEKRPKGTYILRHNNRFQEELNEDSFKKHRYAPIEKKFKECKFDLNTRKIKWNNFSNNICWSYVPPLKEEDYNELKNIRLKIKNLEDENSKIKLNINALRKKDITKKMMPLNWKNSNLMAQEKIKSYFKTSLLQYYKKNVEKFQPILLKEFSFDLKLEPFNSGKFKCQFCWDEFLMDPIQDDPLKCIKSTCEHQFCKNCFRGYFDHSLQVSALPISCPSCPEKRYFKLLESSPALIGDNSDLISFWELQHYKELYKRLNFIPCKRPNCQGGFHRDGVIKLSMKSGSESEVSFFQKKCPLCRSCHNCGLYHSENMNSCPKNQIDFSGECYGHEGNQENIFENITFIQEQIKNGNMRFCPHCYFLTERSQGCNHMLCLNCKKDWHWNKGLFDKSRYIVDRSYTFDSGLRKYDKATEQKFQGLLQDEKEKALYLNDDFL